MSDWLSAGIVISGLAIASAAVVGMVRRQLLHRQILDRPNTRSSHTAPVPRGGGIGVLIVLLPCWLIADLLLADRVAAALPIPFLAAGLAALSWIDDLHSLPQIPRLLGQALAVGVGVALLPAPVFQGILPPFLDAAVTVILWLWFINLYNFMDGIDGMAGVETVAIGLGLFLIMTVSGEVHLGQAPWQALAIAGTAIGFLYWNWRPARIFLGDVGSIPAGFLAGWLLLWAAANGLWVAALILPLYYLGDASLTLAGRLIRRENILNAHRKHFYQRAVQSGRSHATVVSMVLIANVALIAHAAVATIVGEVAALPALLSAAALVGGLLVWMRLPPGHPV